MIYIDKDRCNNKLSNLECITQEDNLIHSRLSKKGNISKLKILALFKSKEWRDCNEFMMEILKY